MVRMECTRDALIRNHICACNNLNNRIYNRNHLHRVNLESYLLPHLKYLR